MTVTFTLTILPLSRSSSSKHFAPSPKSTRGARRPTRLDPTAPICPPPPAPRIKIPKTSSWHLSVSLLPSNRRFPRGRERRSRRFFRRSMAEHAEEHKGESLIEKIEEKFHGPDSSSSDSDNDRPVKKSEAETSIKDKIWRLFGREKPVHHVLGGGKPADVFLWRNKKISAGVLGGVTAVWVLFELLEYHLLTLVCHCLILSLAVLFLWSNASAFINKSPPHIPQVIIPEDFTVSIALSTRYELNRALASLREIASGRDLKKFLIAIAGLWLLSVLGSCCNFLTLFYITFVLLHTVPVLYEKYEDKIDSFGEKATKEFKKHYAEFDAKVLSKVMSKIPKAPLKDKKLH